MIETTTVTLQTITPIWSAGANMGESDRIHETAVIGTLRWWYEAMIRGLGGTACDPSSKESGARCQWDAEKFGQALKAGCTHPERAQINLGRARLCSECLHKALAKAGLCPACQLFGATGWARMFTLGVVDAQLQPTLPFAGKMKISYSQGGRESKYYFKPGRAGRFQLRIRPRLNGDDETLKIVLGLLDFIRRHAFLGAKTSLGYGVFSWIKPAQAIPSAEFVNLVAERATRLSPGLAPDPTLPDLKQMFFGQYQMNPGAQRPEAFAEIKVKLRGVLRYSSASGLTAFRHKIFGFVDQHNRDAPVDGSKVKAALFGNGQYLRIYGWIPLVVNGVELDPANINHIMNAIGKEPLKLSQEIGWDSFLGNYKTGKDFLLALMEEAS